jgi:uncharacterized protein with beta-barrel porin domain
MRLALCASDRRVARPLARRQLNYRNAVLLATMALIAATAFVPGAVRAQNATWNLNPGSADYNTATNWTPALVPASTAFFGASNTTTLTFSGPAGLDGWTFTALAPNYNFTVSNQTLAFFGAGIVMNGGSVSIAIDSLSQMSFFGLSTAGTAAITNNGGVVDFSASTGPAGDNKLSAGSIAGAGAYLLGANELTVGGDNLSTGVSGVISGTSGSLVKVGTGTMTLSGTNTYTGSTTVSDGTLAISASGSITSDVTNNAAFTNDGTVSGTVTNSGTFNNNLTGTVSGLLTNTAGTTTNAGALNGDAVVNGGTLANSASGNISNVTNNAAFTNDGAVTGAVTNFGTFNNNVGGTVSGVLTNTAGTTTNAGTLNGVVNGGLLSNNAAITGAVTNSGTFNNNVGGTVSGLLTNTSGTTTNAGALNGGAVVNGGTLANSASGNISNVTNNAAFTNDGAVTGAVTNSGMFNNNAGSMVVGLLTNTSGTTTNAGALDGGAVVNGGALANSASGSISNVTNNAAFTNDGAVTGAVTNSGMFNNNVGGTVSGLLTNTAGTTTNAGALNGDAVVNGGTLANSASGNISNVTNNAAFTNDGTVSGAVTNSGTFNNNASGMVVGLLTNTAGTTMNAGALNGGAVINGGTLANSGTISNVTNNAAFTNDGTVSGAVTNSGTFNNNGGGTVSGLLTNASGTTTNAGALNGGAVVNGGLLAVNGTAAAVTVNAGGTLGGNGTVGNTVINGGALAPGNSIGLLTINGNLTFTAASSYMVEVSPATADRTNVTGTATLGGAKVNASFAPGTYVQKQYTILNAIGGVGGTFAGPVNTNLPANFTSSLSYDATNAYLNLLLSFTPPNPPAVSGLGGLNQNQRNVASAIIGFFNANGGIPAAFGGLTPAGLTQASGELATAPQQTTFDAMNLFMGILTDPFISGRGDPVAGSTGALPFAGENNSANAYVANDKALNAYAAIYHKAPVMAAPFAQRWSVWAAVYGGSQTTDGNAALGSNDTTSRIAGGVVGADYRFSPDTIAGFALAGGGTNFSVANGLGSGRSDLFQFGAFARHNVGPAYLLAALAYGWQDITTDRTVTVVGGDQLHAKFNANAWSGRVESGYRFVEPALAIGITPYAAGQFTTFDLPAYAEQTVAGATTFALDYGAKTVTASISELGLRGDKSFAMQDGIFTLRGRAAWAHNFNPDRSIGATFQTLPGASFVVNGAAQAPDAALVTASADMKWRNGWSTAVTFEGGFSNVTASYAGKAVARYSW